MLSLGFRSLAVVAAFGAFYACGNKRTLTSSTSTSTATSALDTQASTDACANLAAGAACTFTTHDGQSLTGTCGQGRDANDGLRCIPPGGPGDGHGPGGGPMGPPQVAIDACASLAADAACTFAGRDGETVTGTCKTGPDGSSTLACAPAGGPGGPGGPDGEGMGPPQAAIDACASLAADAACTFTDPMGTDVTGTCKTGPDGSSPLACAPAGGPGGPGGCPGPHGG